MGINTQDTSYNFGQFGSAFAAAGNANITPPEGKVIVSIQFLGNAKFAVLTAEDPLKYINTISLSNHGDFQEQINGTVTSSTTITFDNDIADTNITVGDEVYDDHGDLLGTVTVLNPGDEAKDITISASVSITDDAILAFRTPGDNSTDYGVGGEKVPTTQEFPAGTTIVGRWTRAELDGTTAGPIIAYFGK